MRMLAALAALALAGASPPPALRPALWKVADADTTIYLFGTFHALPAGFGWRDAQLDRAFRDSDRLYIETILADPAGMGALMIRLGTPAAPLPPLIERVPEAQRPMLEAVIARSGVPAATLDGMETWAAAFLLAAPMMSDLGVSAADGVEESLKRDFAAAAKPVAGLETVEGQLGVVDTLSEADQRRLLEGMMEQAAEARPAFHAMLTAWGRGDEAAIARTFDTELDGSPSLRAALLTRRNAAWARQIATLLDTPGTMTVAVGAGHLAGVDSVQAMLRARGLTVTRVR